jgi:integrase
MPGLTEKAIGAARAQDGERFLWDGELPGFGCRIKPSGAKTFFIQYRVGRATRRVKVGRWPVMKVEPARMKALKLLAEIGDGGDPSARRRKERSMQGDTFEAAAKAFLAKRKELRTWNEAERIFRVYVTPVIGKRPLHEIARRELIDLLDKIADERGGSMANRTLAHLRPLFRWAVSRDVIGADPSANIPKPAKERPRQRILDDDELRWIWRAADTIGGRRGAFVKLLMLSGQRRSEVAGMRRSEFDRAARVWTLPVTRSKTAQIHEVPLPEAAWAIIDGLPKHGNSVLAENAETDAGLLGFAFVKQALDVEIARLQLTHAVETGEKVRPLTGWRLHDLRRTVRTRLAALGVAPEIAELVIGHQRKGIEAVYNLHTHRLEKASALVRWATALANIVSDRARQNVVPLSAAAGQR